MAWGGALVFVAALAVFLYAYFGWFGATPGPGPIVRPILLDVGLFSIFALHHSLFARTRLKGWVKATIPPELERSLYTWISSGLLVAVCWWWQPVPGVLVTLDGPWWWIATGVQIAGIAFAGIGSRALDVLDLAGVRPVRLARQGDRAAPHVPLMTSGVYGIVRHPLYFGWTLLVFATPHLTATRAVFAIVSCAYLALAIRWEERSLIDTFGREYETYRGKVRWRMVPGVY